MAKRFDWSVLSPDGTARDRKAGPLSDTEGQTGQSPVPQLDQQRTARDAPESGETSIELRVNDLKQFAYCPRIVFYQYTMPVQRKATFKMEHGKAVEPRIEHLEHRRTLRAYGLQDGRRQFQVWLRSKRLGLSGRLDMMITTPDGIFPVDFKDTLRRVHDNHRVQLCAYAMLIEDVYQRQVSAGFIYRVPRSDVVAVDMTAELRAETLRCLNAIRVMIRAEHMPSPTSVRARCTDCEYRNYCGDIF
jgi:CRISPR-associated exonuclease Cas4